MQLNQELHDQEGNEETEKLQIIYDLCQEDAKELTNELNRLKEENAKLSEDCEVISNNLKFREIDTETKRNIKEIEEENRFFSKNHDSSFSIERMLNADSDKKVLNETFVILQKRLDHLEGINTNLEKKVKKSEADTKNLKKKCENALGRYKSNDDLKDKIKKLELVAENYTSIENSLQKEIEEAENKLKIEKSRPENQIDVKTAQRLVSEVLETLQQEKSRHSVLENELKEKKLYLHEIRTYGTQTNKTTIKLRDELSLVEMVLQEKKHYLEELDREIEDYQKQCYD